MNNIPKLYTETKYTFQKTKFVCDEGECWNQPRYKNFYVLWRQYDDSKVLECKRQIDSNNVFAKGNFRSTDSIITCHQVKSENKLRYICTYRNMTVSDLKLETVLYTLYKMATG